VNIIEGEREVKTLHQSILMVKEVFCIQCARAVGWKVEESPSETHKWKEGKFELEGRRIKHRL